jgi:glycerol-3-phosphate dehydrogenase
LVIENLQDAVQNGGKAFNYVEIESFERKDNLYLVSLVNKESQDKIKIQTKHLVNATGPFADKFIQLNKENTVEQSQRLDLVAGSHLNVFPPISNESFYITADDNRLIFILKRSEDGFDFSRIGTTEREIDIGSLIGAVHPTEKEVDYLISTVREFFPQAQLNEKTIFSKDAGIRPLLKQDRHGAFQKSREHEIYYEEGLFHILGVKLTDYRRAALEVIDVLSNNGLEIKHGNHQSLLNRRKGDGYYLESTIEEFILRTQILHWDDYVYRRKGSQPLLKIKNAHPDLEFEFDQMAKIMNWDLERRKAENNRV